MVKKQIALSFNIHYKIWLESATGEGIMGDGKWLLLETIDRLGSLSAAASELNISYRKAWGDIKKAEVLLGSELIEKHRGGSSGGNSTLTEYGKRWLVLYKDFHKKMDKVFKGEVEKFKTEIKKFK